MKKEDTPPEKQAALLADASRLLAGGGMGLFVLPPELNLVVAEGAGSRIRDVAGREYIDYHLSSGPALLGHAHPAITAAVAAQLPKGTTYHFLNQPEIELARRLVSAIPCAEVVHYTGSGTEATFYALRIARAATRRKYILKFDGCYHGHSDSLLVRAGSGGMTLGVPDSDGVPEELASLTLIARYNSLEHVDGYFRAHPSEIAAVIIEPVAANMGIVAPEPGFLSELAGLCRRHGALVICDEVITGFRLRYGAVSQSMGVEPDLVLLGKVIGGGMPIGAVAGRADLMDLLAPKGPVYQAGTLSGNPLSVRAGLETLRLLRALGTYERLDAAGARLEAGLKLALADSGVTGCVNRAGSLLTLFLGVDRVRDADDARRADPAMFARFFHAMLQRGVNLPPSQFEALFVSLAHSDADLDRTISAARAALHEVRAA